MSETEAATVEPEAKVADVAEAAPAEPPLEDAGLKALRAERDARKAAEKAARDAQARLEELERQQLSEQERAVVEAREEGRRSAAEEYARRVAEAEFRASLTGRVSDVDTLLETVDIARFIKDGDVDRDAIAATSEKLSRVAPAAPVAFPTVDLGPQTAPAGQLTADELKSLSPDQIAEAFAAGRLKSLGFG